MSRDRRRLAFCSVNVTSGNLNFQSRRGSRRGYRGRRPPSLCLELLGRSPGSCRIDAESPECLYLAELADPSVLGDESFGFEELRRRYDNLVVYFWRLGVTEEA